MPRAAVAAVLLILSGASVEAEPWAWTYQGVEPSERVSVEALDDGSVALGGAEAISDPDTGSWATDRSFVA